MRPAAKAPPRASAGAAVATSEPASIAAARAAEMVLRKVMMVPCGSGSDGRVRVDAAAYGQGRQPWMCAEARGRKSRRRGTQKRKERPQGALRFAQDEA